MRYEQQLLLATEHDGLVGVLALPAAGDETHLGEDRVAHCGTILPILESPALAAPQGAEFRATVLSGLS